MGGSLNFKKLSILFLSSIIFIVLFLNFLSHSVFAKGESGEDTSESTNESGTDSTSGTQGSDISGTAVGSGGSDTGAGDDGGGDSGYVPPPDSGPPVQTLTSVISAGCDGVYPLVRYDFTASWTNTTIKYEVWRWRKDLDNWTVVREVSAPGSYLDNTLDSNSYQAPYTEYAIVRVDSNWGRLESNHIQTNIQNCNPTTAPPAPPPETGGPPPSPPPANAAVTIASASNGACSGVYPRVNVDFSSNFNPAGGYELWHFNNPYRGWEKFGNAASPGTYTDTMADSNWYQGVTTYMVRAIDAGGGRLLDSNNVAITTANCNSEVAGGGVVTLNSALNSSCSGIYPQVAVNFSSNFNPPGGYQLWHINNPYRGWEVFATANAPGTYTDTMADSNWYQGVTTYMVRAVDSTGGRLIDSNNISVVTPNCNLPSSAQFIPPSPRAYCSTNEARVTLSWTIPQNFSANNGDRYYIQRVDGADNRVEYGPTEANSFEDGNIAVGQIYSYNIRAVTSAGVSDSGWSSAVSALNCGAPVTNLYINNSRAPLSVLSGTQAQISWDSQNATGCVGSSDPSQSGWDGARNASGSRSTGALSRPPDRVSYTLSCTNINNGQADVKTVSVDIRTPSSCIKTTGGDVHSNEGIAGPVDCP